TSTNAKFSIFNETSFSVAAGDSHIVVVRYTPTIAQSDTGTLRIFPSGYPAEKVYLRGTGKTPVAIINVTPTSLSFGSITVGKTSDLILNIRNIGQLGLNVANITHSNNHFSITGPISFTVPPGETYPIMASFSLNALGIQNDVLSIYSNDTTNNPLNISMTGSGTSTLLPEISISPFELRFDSIAVGQSDTLSLRLYNLGASNLNVTGMSTTDSAYSVLNVNSFTISAGDSINALIRFMSTYDGRQQGFLTISSNDPNENLLSIRLTNAPKILVGVESEERQIPESYHLFQNYPNPFNPRTRIQYAVVSNQLVSLKVYDILGRELKTLVNEIKQPGTYEVEWDASNLPSGIYFYRLISARYSAVKKMVLLR
ncbi:MAG TPA: choice-of-anchor D domain-containing protein, partial [Bacteroidota bacterium]|nr:choice-of-anchor D domain-containing protein [Bacteroidota bacterium]